MAFSDWLTDLFKFSLPQFRSFEFEDRLGI